MTELFVLGPEPLPFFAEPLLNCPSFDSRAAARRIDGFPSPAEVFVSDRCVMTFPKAWCCRPSEDPALSPVAPFFLLLFFLFFVEETLLWELLTTSTKCSADVTLCGVDRRMTRIKR